MLLHLLRNILRVSFASSAVIAPMLILLPVIRKNYTAGWRCFVWLLIALRLLIPLSPALLRPPAAVAPVTRNINITVPRESPASPGRAGKENVRQPAKAPEPFISPSPAPRKAGPDHILPVVWLLGAAFFMLFHLTGYFTLKKSVLRFSKPVDLGHAASIWREVKEEMKISGNIRLLSCCKVRSPMITGFFRPLLLLPDLNYDDAELKLVLKHELIHYRRRDVWYKLLLVCANAAHWFNPLVYLVTAASNKDIEMACDSELVKGSDAEFRKRYSETILSAIHKGSGRQTAFSTYFYGGGKTMKERFSNIFDMNKKLKGVFSFCVIAVILCFAGASVTYGVSDVKRGGNIDNIALQSAGNTYDLEDGKFVISYGSGDSAAVPLAPENGDRAAYFSDKAVYISDEITAVACGGDKSPVTVLVSPDKGQTWRSCAVGGTAGSDYPDKFVGFITADKGWLLLAGDTAMGHQENRIFMTSDGGKTWREIGNTSGTYARVVTGAGFADENTGFVSFRYDTDINPVVFRTEDKGKTWTKCSLEIPESFKSVTTYATALSPVFNGAKGILPVTFRNNSWKGDPVDVTVRYETSDYGKTWTFNDKYNLALVWADAWSTRDGRARFGIMSQKMQAEFRAQQSSPDNYVVRWSSPWVVSCDVSLDGDQAVVTYLYTDSTTAAYKGVERLSFGTENGRTVIAGCRTETDMEEYVDTSGWKPVDTGLYKFRIPKEWEASVFEDGSVCLSFSSNGDELGRIEILDYDPSLTVSQFEGNHAETLSREDLPGCKYPAARVVIRRTKPAAANDNSYVGEQHVYLIPKNSGYAVDLSFDSPYVNKKASEIAKSLVLDIDRLKIQNAARQWAEAVKTRDGKAQYDLMSPKLQKSRFADYQEQNWVTGQSSPWVDGYRITPGDKTAGVVYTYMTSEGFAGYYFQTLSFVTENGQPKISGFTDPAQANGNSSGIVVAYLDEKDTWLSAARSNGGMFSDMTLSVNGKTKRFPWKTYSEPAFLPELSYADVDGDGKSELVAILCEGEGTGVNQEEIHVINPENFSEITVQSPIRALSDHAVSKIDKNGVSITIDSQNPIILSEKEIEAKVADKKSWFSDLETGSIIDYSVDGNNIVARVAAQLSPAGFLGDFKIKYKYSDHRLNAGDVSFSQDM